MKSKHKKHLLRILLTLLILSNMFFIFIMSAQSGESSGGTSQSVSKWILRMTIPDFEILSPLRQQALIDAVHGPIRTLAHMAEFGLLGLLTFGLLLTYKGSRLMKYASAQGLVLVYAILDELHQHLRAAGRAAEAKDVILDLSGSLLASGLLALLIYILKKKRKPMKIKTTYYTLPIRGIEKEMVLAHVSDLHGMGEAETLAILERVKPDIILIPGDLMEDRMLADPKASGYAFLRKASALAPTFYSLGNHETGCYHSGKPWTKPTKKPLPANAKGDIAATGAVLLDNESTTCMGLHICGLTSGLDGRINRPHENALAAFSALKGPRVLLCHHPEYYMPYIQKTEIELVLSGHAHGGQWRIFGRGVYAPGQGIFPKYTSGILDGRCVISRGIGNHTHYPRIFNSPQVILIRLTPRK